MRLLQSSNRFCAWKFAQPERPRVAWIPQRIFEKQAGVMREGPLEIEEGCGLKIGSRAVEGALACCESTRLKYVSAAVELAYQKALDEPQVSCAG